MNKEFNVEFNEIDIETFKELIKGKGIRHFKLESDLYGVLDVVLYEEYQKLQQRIDKAIEFIKEHNVFSFKEDDHDWYDYINKSQANDLLNLLEGKDEM